MRSLAVLLLGVVCLLPPAGASASGFNLAWGDCPAMGGTGATAFACNTNSGSHVLVGSFVCDSLHPAFQGAEITVDLHSDSNVLPDWWQLFNPSCCRSSALGASFDFVAQSGDSCVDPWHGLAQGGVASYHTAWTIPIVPDEQTHSARIKIGAVMVDSVPLTPGVEYYAFKLVLNNTRTVGTGSCSGCDVPCCIRLTELRLVDAGGRSELLTTPLRSALVQWQTPSQDCEAVEQARTIWGEARSGTP